MAVKRIDEYEHNNPNLSIVDGNNVRGSTKIVADQAAMLALPIDKLKEGTKAIYKIGGEFVTWQLNTLSGSTNINNWTQILSASQVDLSSKVGVDQLGVAGGVATLDSNGKVPTEQLPASVDTILEFSGATDFPLSGDSSTIYVALDTSLSYRWGGTTYTAIGGSLILGEVAETAFRGDLGKIAYDHSLIVSGNPHNVTKTEINLGDVDNTSDMAKPVSSAQTAVFNTKLDTGSYTGGTAQTLKDEIDTKVDKSNVLEKDNTVSGYTPTLDYQPATKKYVDDKIVSGTTQGVSAPAFTVILGSGKSLGKYSNGDVVPSATTIQAQLRDIGQETVNPILKSPTFDIQLDNSTNPPAREVGFPYTPTMQGIFSQGDIEGALLNGAWSTSESQGPRSGPLTVIEYNGGEVNTTLPSVTLSANTIDFGSVNIYSAIAYYSDSSIQPLNSSGGNFSSPLIGGSITKSLTVTGRFNYHFGISTETSLTSSQIKSLSSFGLTSSEVRTFTNVSASLEYFYYCYPERYGPLSNLEVDGTPNLLGGVSEITGGVGIIVTNQHNIPEPYLVYRSNTLQNMTSSTLKFT